MSEVAVARCMASDHSLTPCDASAEDLSLSLLSLTPLNGAGTNSQSVSQSVRRLIHAQRKDADTHHTTIVLITHATAFSTLRASFIS